VTVVDGGRLANKIWEYAAVWSVARLMGRPGYVPDTILTPLKEVFTNLSLHSLDEIKHCDLELGAEIRRSSLLPLETLKQEFKGQNMLLEKWILLPQSVLKFLNIAKDEFQFRPEILREVEATVKQVGGEGRTRIGIHVRRTDYFKYLQFGFHTNMADKKYYRVSIT
jgi:Glycosyl transferase family 11